jgi:hypothetical protein
MQNKSTVLVVFCVSLLFAAFSLSCKSYAKGDGKVINVKVLSINGCEATLPTIDLVKSVARELHVEIKLTHVVVETSEQAKKEHFLGSPTVQINGLDIDPGSGEIQYFGVT